MLSGNDRRWLNLAIQQAEAAPHEKWRVGAALVRGGSLLSVGFNRYRNDPSKVHFDGVSYHAEEIAIRRAGDPRGATMFVARLTKSGQFGMARPCDRCQEILLTNGIRTIVYTTPIGPGKERLQYVPVTI